MRVRVVGAPGYADFEGKVIPGLHRVSVAADIEPRTVLVDSEREIHVIPSEFVHIVEEEQS